MHYRWHPLCDCKLRLIKTAKVSGIDELHCETPSGIVLGIPRWMTDAGCCLVMEIGDLEEVVLVPADKQKEVEQVLADLLLGAAGADAEEGRRNPS